MEDVVKVWDNCVVVAEIPKTNTMKIVVQLCAKEGVKHINFREFYYSKKAGEWKPSKSGFSMPVQYPFKKDGDLMYINALRQMIDALQSALDQAKGFKLWDDDNAVYVQKFHKRVAK